MIDDKRIKLPAYLSSNNNTLEALRVAGGIIPRYCKVLIPFQNFTEL